jgi:HTH-type transcriptional regulator / antitoxin HigA
MADFETLNVSWNQVSQFIFKPESDDDLDKLIELSGYLIDHLEENERFEDLLHIVGNLISEYESLHIEIPDATGLEVLKFLMDQHGLKQKDLSEIGSAGVVSEILAGKRELNKRHISTLSNLFGCSPAAFF